MPDFECDLHWEINSSIIPYIEKLLPQDSFKMLKHGPNYRMDFVNIKLARNSKLRKSEFKKDFSLIFRDSPNEHMILLDWNKSEYCSLNEI